MNVPGGVFNAITGSPFINPATGLTYAAGTRFHFTSAVVLSDLAYQPPMGSVLMMDAYKDLTLQDGASLNLAGVSITAACDGMWGRLFVRNSAVGISSTFADGATGEVTEAGFYNPPGSSTLRNQLSHSLGGIEFEQPASTVLNSAGGVNVPYCHLAATDFLHNEQSIVLHRDNYGQNTAGGINYTYVSYSAFDSRPKSFKAPKAFAVGTPDYPHYSRYHALFTGHGGQFYGSSFKHALIALHNPDDGQAATLRVYNGQFTDCYLAGVNVNATNNGIQGQELVYVSGSTFTFPTLLSLPTTPQFADALATDVLGNAAETRGIFINNPANWILNCTFTQPNDAYASFAFTERTKQVGAKAQRVLGYTNNTCTLLHTGLELSNVIYGGNIVRGGPIVTDNVFTACRRGIEVHGGGVAYRGGNCCPPATVSLPLSCNTFDRGDGNRPGIGYGSYLEYGTGVTFDPLPIVSPAPTLKNKFYDYLTGRSGFYAIYNAGTTRDYWVRYTSYSNYVLPSAPPMLFGHNNLNLLCSNITLYDNGNYSFNQACGAGNPGLERTTKPQSSLEPSSPNPASYSTTLHYHLASDAETAEIQIRRVYDGQLMHRDALHASSTAYQLGLRGWPAGMYVVTLYVNATPSKSIKLIVQ